MEGFSCHVPVEIVTQIMSWLPPKSLRRFKCVSKSWRSLINGLIKDPEFLSKHLHNTNKVLSSGTRHLFHLSNVILRENMFSLFAVSSYCADGEEKPVEFDPEILNLPIFTGVRWLGFPGYYHCNGIICLDGHNDNMLLCNPVLREFLIVKPGEADHEYGFGSGSLGMGFGYDSKTDDYKIVRILTSPDGAEQSYSSDSDEANDSSSPCYGAELTTLGSGIWRTIESQKLGLRIIEKAHGPRSKNSQCVAHKNHVKAPKLDSILLFSMLKLRCSTCRASTARASPKKKKMANLPEELVVEIMSWLPPESLIQFKCVSKHWYFLINYLINDSNFVSKHLRNLDNNILAPKFAAFSCLKIYQTPVYSYKELFAVLSLIHTRENDVPIRSFAEDLDLPIIPGEKDMSCVTACHCNGVICLADYYHNIVLCNPAMKKSRALPKPNIVDRFVLQGVGFGYDSRSDDYKVVRFGREMSVYPRAELYSLRSDSWKEVKIDSGTDYFPSLHIEVYFNGAFYWLMSGPKSMVRSFDMSEEVFRSVPLPDGVETAKAHCTSLVVWNGSVALILCEGERGAPISIEVWVMIDNVGGVKGCCSWSKKLAIGPFEGVDSPLGFWNEEEILMRSTNFKEIFSYNIRTKKLRNVNVDGVDGIGCRAFSYVKSLVSV